MKKTIEDYKLKIENCKLWIVVLIHFSFFNLQSSIFNPPAWAGDRPVAPAHPLPTLARLSFWVPPKRMAEFEAIYNAKIVPILKTHGLVESAQRGRATPDSVFSRLFEFKTPSEMLDKQKALQGDSTWTAMLRGFGTTFGIDRPNNPFIRNEFTFYAAPAGLGKVIPAGPGKVIPAGPGMGYSHTYDVSDGLAGGGVHSILQDREGVLWFGCGDGVSRYDGQTFTTFTTKDGLAHNNVQSILQDREGVLWFGTYGGGVSRYDPKAGDRSPSTPLRSAQEETGDRKVLRQSSGQALRLANARSGQASTRWRSLRAGFGGRGAGLDHLHHERWTGKQLHTVDAAGPGGDALGCQRDGPQRSARKPV